MKKFLMYSFIENKKIMLINGMNTKKNILTRMNFGFTALFGAKYLSSIGRAFAEIALVLVDSSRSADLFRPIGRSWAGWLISTLRFFPFLTFLLGTQSFGSISYAFADVALVVESLTGLANFLHSACTVFRLLVF